ncbi:MAG: DUF1501 domain-containing protein [Planctomycetales bacterium]|nr:DUF1501 domain-containing protein [Planctomycetales bacterium]
MQHLPWQKLDVPTRRHFLTRAAQAALGVSFLPMTSPLAQGASGPGKAKRVVYLFLEGAASHMDTFDPKPGAAEQGGTKAIGTKISGVQFGEHIPLLAASADKLAVVRSMATATAAHDQARYLMRTSYKMIATTRHPSMGAWLQHFRGRSNKELPGAVVVGNSSRHPGAGYLNAAMAPAPVPTASRGLENTKPPKYLTDDQFDKRMRLSSRFDQAFLRHYQDSGVQSYLDFYSEAVSLLKSSDLDAFDINKEDAKVKERYGATPLGQGCLLARRLLEVGINFVEVVSGGWDLHRDIFTTMPNKGGELDQAMTALLEDLEQKGMLEDTLVVLTTEFGRTPKINQNSGRDHHPSAFSSVLAGGGIAGGQVYGKTDKSAIAVDENPVAPEDLNATIAQALNLPLKQEVISPVGRPFKVAHDGTPLPLF